MRIKDGNELRNKITNRGDHAGWMEGRRGRTRNSINSNHRGLGEARTQVGVDGY